MGFMETSTVVLWMFLITFVYLGLFILPAIRLKKAIYQMIEHFRGLQSSCLTGVRTMDELGMRNPGLLDGFLRSRDFRPYALQVLIQEDVVKHENEMLCLREDKLRDFMLKYKL
jgi:hypothetical protein